MHWLSKTLPFGAAMAILLTVAISPPPASAQAYPCPQGPGPGEEQVGSTPEGHGVAGMPLCLSTGSEEPSRAPEREGTADVRNAYNSFLETLGTVPNAWSYPPPENGVCSAFFSGDGGYAIVRVPRGSATRSTPSLTFWSREAPRRIGQQAHAVDLVLENGPTDGERISQRVRISFDPNLGEFTLTLPSNRVLLRGIEDRMTFKLSGEDKTFVDFAWVDGDQAKEYLARCLA